MDDDDVGEEDDDEVDDNNEEEEQEEARHGWRRRQLSTSLCGAAGVAPAPGLQSTRQLLIEIWNKHKHTPVSFSGIVKLALLQSSLRYCDFYTSLDSIMEPTKNAHFYKLISYLTSFFQSDVWCICCCICIYLF